MFTLQRLAVDTKKLLVNNNKYIKLEKKKLINFYKVQKHEMSHVTHTGNVQINVYVWVMLSK